MHYETLHDICQDQEMALLCFPIPLLHGAVVPFVTVERLDHRVSSSQHVFCPGSLLLVVQPLILLLFFPWLQLSFAVCCLLSHFIFCSLSLSAALSFTSSSSALCCSGIAPDHSASKYRLLTVGLCSPHLDHVILKSGGTALLFSMSACLWRRGEKKTEQERGKRCHPQPSQRDECTLTKSPL